MKKRSVRRKREREREKDATEQDACASSMRNSQIVGNARKNTTISKYHLPRNAGVYNFSARRRIREYVLHSVCGSIENSRGMLWFQTMPWFGEPFIPANTRPSCNGKFVSQCLELSSPRLQILWISRKRSQSANILAYFYHRNSFARRFLNIYFY